jgi:MFS family permease
VTAPVFNKFCLKTKRFAFYPMEKKDNYRYVIAALVTLVRVCVGLIWASAGPLLPLMMQEYNINRGTVSWYVSSVPIIMAVLTVPIGIVGARFGLKKMFAVGAFLQAAGILAPFCTSYPLLFLTRVAFAVGTAITVPMASAVVAGWFTSRELPLVNGVIMSFVTLGNTFSYIATIPIATVISWKAPITIYGAFALTCATAWFIFGKERRGEPVILTQGAIAALENKPEFSLKQALLQKSTLIFAFTLLGPFCCSNALISWLPSYYNEVFKIPLDKASSMTAIFTVTGAIACILGGILPMRIGRRKPFLIIPGMFMGLLALSCISFNNDWLIYASVAMFGIFNNIQAPSIFLHHPDGAAQYDAAHRGGRARFLPGHRQLRRVFRARYRRVSYRPDRLLLARLPHLLRDVFQPARRRATPSGNRAESPKASRPESRRAGDGEVRAGALEHLTRPAQALWTAP